MSLLTAIVAYWKMDEISGTRFDSVNGHDLTPHNAPGRAAGKLNYGAELVSADSQYLEIASTSDLQGGDVELTIAFWIKFTQALTGEQDIVCKTLPPGAQEYVALLQPPSAGVSRLEFSVTSQDQAHTAGVSATSFGAIAKDQWYLVICRHDPTNDIISIQVNNGAVDTAAFSYGIAATSTPFRIGTFSGTGLFSDIVIDGLGIWKSAAGGGGLLTSDDAAKLWNGGAGLDYPFNEAAVQVRFGDFTFPRGFKVEEDPISRAIGVAKAARQDGGRVQTGTLAEKRVTVRGGLIYQPMGNADGNTWRDALMNIREALAQGPANLYLWADRYYPNMQCIDYRQSTPDSDFGRIAMIELDMVGPTPFLVSTIETDETWSSPVDASTHASNPGGTAYSLPTFSFTIGGAGAQTLAITVTNQTNNYAFTLSGAANGGDIVIVNADAKTVTIGATNRMDLFDGLFPRLESGANALSLGLTGCTLSALTIAWRDRWY